MAPLEKSAIGGAVLGNKAERKLPNSAASPAPAIGGAIPENAPARNKLPKIKSSTKAEVMNLAQKIIRSAQTKNWEEYCQLLAPHSRYNLILNIAKGSETCQDALQKKRSLAEQIHSQSQVLSIDRLVPMSNLVVAVDIRLPDKSMLSFIALKYLGVWGGDLHPPRNTQDLRRVMKKLVPEGSEINPGDSGKNIKEKDIKATGQSSGGCVPSFLVKPLRREISVELNRQITAPAAEKTGL